MKERGSSGKTRDSNRTQGTASPKGGRIELNWWGLLLGDLIDLALILELGRLRIDSRSRSSRYGGRIKITSQGPKVGSRVKGRRGRGGHQEDGT